MTGASVAQGFTGRALRTVEEVLGQMPAPSGRGHVERLEATLATTFGTAEAVAVSSGTAALHAALAAAGIGPGDEVLVPAASVVMSVAAIAYTGARPVLIDLEPSGDDLDYDDLIAKTSTRTRAILPVHLAGRCADLSRLAAYAANHDLEIIEDACQAQGSRHNDAWAGTVGTAGCFSLKDGKICWAGEGGYILTNDYDLAERARSFRTHALLATRPESEHIRFGHNYRLAEPLAALAHVNLARFDELLQRRQQQTALLTGLVADATPPGLRPLAPTRQERWNGYSPLFRLDLARPREFCERLADAGVPNSVGTFGLVSADQLGAIAPYDPAPCPISHDIIDRTLAVAIDDRDTDDRLCEIAETIATEATQWA